MFFLSHKVDEPVECFVILLVEEEEEGGEVGEDPEPGHGGHQHALHQELHSAPGVMVVAWRGHLATFTVASSPPLALASQLGDMSTPVSSPAVLNTLLVSGTQLSAATVSTFNILSIYLSIYLSNATTWRQHNHLSLITAIVM